jgi:triphosphoribosyl-dephospho-CoA synthase
MTNLQIVDSARVAAAAQLACLLEASAPKPGNVSPGRPFADTRYEDFLASAAAIGPSFTSAATQPVGATIRAAIEATSRWTSSNTNLGIVLLLAPLAKAAVCLAAERSGGAGRIGPFDALRRAVMTVLEKTSIEDARDVYAAIRLANPGGLGRSKTQDVASEPTMTLLEVMRLAAERDGIAREYATGFRAIFESGVPGLTRARRDGLAWDAAVVETFLTLLSAAADTHVARRAGAAVAADVSSRAAAVLAAGGVRSEPGRRAIAEMDAALRDPRHLANPGTTADLTAATIFVVLLAGGWHADSAAAPRRT